MWARLVISAIFIVAYVIVLGLWIWFPHPAADDKVTPTLIGVMTGGVMLILTHWFGKSAT